MFHNPKCPCPAILFISNHTKCLSRDIQSLHNCTVCSNIWTMSQNAVNPLSPISKNIQSTVNLSRQCIQFTPVKVHSNTSTLYIYPLEYYIPRHNSLPYSQQILSSSVARCTVLIYGHSKGQKLIECYRTNLKATPVTRFTKEVLETTSNWVPQIY